VRPGESTGQYTQLWPRQPLTATPYALYALSSAGGGGGNTLDESYDQGGAGAGATITADAGPVEIAGPDGLTVTGNLGIGTTTPGEKLDVVGTAQMTGFSLPTGATSGYVLTSDTSGIGTWQPDGLSLPYSGSAAFPNYLFDIENTTGSGLGALKAVGGIVGVRAEGKDAIQAIANAEPGARALLAQATGGNSTYAVWADISGGDPSANANAIFGQATGSGQWAGSFAGDVRIVLGRRLGIGDDFLGTNKPQAALHIGGTPGVDGIMFPDGTLQTTAGGAGGGGGWIDDGTVVRLANSTDDVGIGTTNPQNPLAVQGQGTDVGGVATFGEVVARVKQFFSDRHTALSVDSHANQDAIVYLAEDGAAAWDLRNDVSAGQFQVRYHGANERQLVIDAAGNVGIGTTSPGVRLDVNGTTRTEVLEITGGSDLAEPFEVAGPKAVQPGMVVSIDSEHLGQLRVSSKAYDRAVAGIVSGAGGIYPGMMMRQKGSLGDGSIPVALSGRVYCWCAATNGAIVPGDRLTTSNIRGHAMKVTHIGRASGAVIGKAMTPLAEGRGLVLVLVQPQ
jgi:hypothetical protein